MTTVLNLNPLTTTLTREQFYLLCQNNPDLQLERNPQGELIIMSPVGGESGKKESSLNFQISLWNYQTNSGVVFSSSTMFNLPGGGSRSPDVAWVSLEKWDSLTPEDREKFLPICPDFVIELRSKTDRLKPLQDKMQEYLASGLLSGWLINPKSRQVEIYRQGQSVEILAMPTVLSGEDVLPGLTVNIDY